MKIWKIIKGAGYSYIPMTFIASGLFTAEVQTCLGPDRLNNEPPELEVDMYPANFLGLSFNERIRKDIDFERKDIRGCAKRKKDWGKALVL